MIRALGLAHAGRRERRGVKAEERAARRQAVEAALARLDELATERALPNGVITPLRAQHRARLKHSEHHEDGNDGHKKLAELHHEIELLVIGAERRRTNELFCAGKLTDEARRRIEHELDLREAQLANHRDED